MFTTDQIAQNIANLLPFKEWKDEHLVITGGEPLLGWQRAYPDLLENEHLTNLKELTFETNGSQALTEEFKEYLKQWTSRTCPNGYVRKYDDLTFSVSAKLSCSGENRADAIRPDLVCEYEKLGYTYLKFVVASEDDAKEAIETTKLYRDAGFLGPVYLMPVGGVEKVYQLNHRKVAELAMKNGLRYSDRLQVPLFKNEWGT
jgi:organic radical activating enzyme